MILPDLLTLLRHLEVLFLEPCLRVCSLWKVLRTKALALNAITASRLVLKNGPSFGPPLGKSEGRSFRIL